jgi:outer membrane biosynthesis protein TonB
VRSAVQREKRYPRDAERRGVEGQSTVRIVLMAAVHGVGRYPPIPPEMREASVTITRPFDFRRR